MRWHIRWQRLRSNDPPLSIGAYLEAADLVEAIQQAARLLPLDLPDAIVLEVERTDA